MTEKENFNPCGLLHRIASAYPGTERENVKQELDEFLASSSQEDACALSEQLPGIVAQCLWDAVLPYTMSPLWPDVVLSALADYRKLASAASPCALLTEKAVEVVEKVKKIESLPGYLKSRDELEQSVYPLSKAESEAVFWHLRGRLEELLLEEIVQVVMDQDRPPANLEAQYDLWQDLKLCQRFGVGHLALYFLDIKKEAFRVLLPCCFSPGDGAKETFQAARTIAILSPQLPTGERAVLFSLLFLWVEYMALKSANQKPNEDTQAIQELYMMLLATLKRTDGRFWDNPRFRELSDTLTSHSQSQKEDE